MVSKIFIIMLTGYLIGSVSPSYLLGKWLRGIDLRNYGSGNVGATNAFRVLGTGPGVAAMVLDAVKGALAVLVAAAIWRQAYHLELVKVLGGMAAICGHNWTLFLKFKGGKGVATSAGVMGALVPPVVIILLVIFLIIVFLTRYVSLGSVTVAILLPFLVWLREGKGIIAYLSILVALFVVVRHIPNVKRLLAGKEHKFGVRIKI